MSNPHERIERNVGLMAMLIAVAVSFGGLAEIVPLMYQAETIKPLPGVKPYPALQLAGRDIYVREGCYNCHSQMVRPIRAETERYGEYSKPGEFVWDHPFQWGSRRIGPDLTRVGLYGGSAGGQSALGGLLLHPDFYKAGAADCGCHDNRMDKIWWNEQWMGWPVGPEYAANSNVTLAPNLQGKLLLVAGELDTNVDPSSTMQVVNALIKADKDFEMLIIPGANHGAMGTPYGQRRLQDFFVRTFLGVEPRSSGNPGPKS
jgi:pimeloyl-ACP methyl ester carboxylesterase